MDTKQNFNFDDIDVGNPNLDHSQNYFARKHITEEKLEQLNNGVDYFCDNKENIKVISKLDPNAEAFKPMAHATNHNYTYNHATENTDATGLESTANQFNYINSVTTQIENEKQAISQKTLISLDSAAIANIECESPTLNQEYTEVDIQIDNLKLNSSCEIYKSNIINEHIAATNVTLESPCDITFGSPTDLEYKTNANVFHDEERTPTGIITMSRNSIFQHKIDMLNFENACENKEQEETKAEQVKRNILTEWSVKNKENAASNALAPKAYVFKDIYERKKALVKDKLTEEEHKKREFRSRPVPNFKEIHKRYENRPVIHYITCPITPVVLKHHRAAVERMKHKEAQENINVNTAEEKKKNVRGVSVFKEPTLYTEKRLQERRKYDEGIKKAIEETKKLKEEERRKYEEAEIKEIRKRTEFKARPNPFK